MFSTQVRATTKALERVAAALAYRLTFRGEVDPGRGFWLRCGVDGAGGAPVYDELEEDGVVYDRSAANELLEDLYHAGRVGPGDTAVVDAEEPTPRHWSRRIHVLERVADAVPVANRFPAHAPFERKAALRHLFATRAARVAQTGGPRPFFPGTRRRAATRSSGRATGCC